LLWHLVGDQKVLGSNPDYSTWFAIEVQKDIKKCLQWLDKPTTTKRIQLSTTISIPDTLEELSGSFHVSH